MQYVISTFHVNLHVAQYMTHVDFLGPDRIYCKPMSDAVSNAMRMLSVEPLTEGVPCHCATDGIFPQTP